MDFMAVYEFLFKTYAGIGCLVAFGLVASLIAAVIMERRIRKQYKNHQPTEDDWSFFDDGDESDADDAADSGKSVDSAGSGGKSAESASGSKKDKEK
ncbi:MAG: hypothetical protein LBB35_03065 [Coriobacteriaceae bacterium]|jgi:hypothetical protein|nr:hypothetical protein [Coriobacteriaceae bacterium]